MGYLFAGFRFKLGSGAALSSAIVAIGLAQPLAAHEVRPAIADVHIGEERIEIVLTVAVEPMIAGIDLEGLSDTNDSPLAAEYDRLRALEADALEDALRADWGDLRSGLRIESAGERVTADIENVEVKPTPDLELPRDTILTLSATLPEGDAPVSVAWKPSYGPIVVREMTDADDAYTGFLTGGAASAEMARQSGGFLGGLFGGN